MKTDLTSGSVEWAWLNGVIQPLAQIGINPEDRGFVFADGVYEVVRIYNGKPFALAEHLQRLGRSAAGILLKVPLSLDDLASNIGKLIERGSTRDGMLYLQLTRGHAPRNHVFPDANQCPPTLLMFVRRLGAMTPPDAAAPVKLLTVPDDRWNRCWIKSIALLPNVLAKNLAVAAGADEAVLVNDGIVTEGSQTNVFAVIDGAVVTHPVGVKVLGGVTRLILGQLAGELGISFQERRLRVEEAMTAQEVFITSTTREVAWAVRWDDRLLSDVRGPVGRRLHEAYQRRVLAECPA